MSVTSMLKLVIFSSRIAGIESQFKKFRRKNMKNLLQKIKALLIAFAHFVLTTIDVQAETALNRAKLRFRKHYRNSSMR